jgi:hypothetical protein
MPPARTIIVDDNAILAAIVRNFTDERNLILDVLAGLQADYKLTHAYDTFCRICDLERQLEVIEGEGIKSDLAHFAGRELTPSWRIRVQQSVRRLEAAGLVARYCTRIKPTEKGINAVVE